MVLHNCDMLGQSLIMPKLVEGCNIQFVPDSEALRGEFVLRIIK